MQISSLFVSALLASTTLALPMPKPHLNLDVVKDIFRQGKRTITSSDGLDFLSLAAKGQAQGDNIPNYGTTSNLANDVPNYATSNNLCYGSDNDCVTGGGQITT